MLTEAKPTTTLPWGAGGDAFGTTPVPLADGVGGARRKPQATTVRMIRRSEASKEREREEFLKITCAPLTLRYALINGHRAPVCHLGKELRVLL
jgi:hypothetical protein